MQFKIPALLLTLFLSLQFTENAMAHSITYSFDTIDYPQHFTYSYDHYPARRESKSYGYQPYKYRYRQPSSNNGCYTKPCYPSNKHRYRSRQ